jgi:hypothetical protein
VWNEASNQYEMWYSGGVYVESFGLTEPLGVGFATSPDGRSFTPYAGNPIVTAPGCSTGLWYCDAVGSFRVRLIDGVYHCFYSAAGNDGVFRIGYTTSTSPTSWNLQSNDLIVDRTPHNTYGHDGNYAPGFVRTNGYWSVWWNGRNEVTGVEAVLMAQEYPQQVVISNAVLGSAVIK